MATSVEGMWSGLCTAANTASWSDNFAFPLTFFTCPKAVWQEAPIKPGVHWHCPMMQAPLLLQLSWHLRAVPTVILQFIPRNPISHTHLPLEHWPRPIQSFGQVLTSVSQASPTKPMSQKHFPKWHCPRSLQPFVQGSFTFSRQSAPAKPGKQKHFPSQQIPFGFSFPPQSFGQSSLPIMTREQSTPS